MLRTRLIAAALTLATLSLMVSPALAQQNDTAPEQTPPERFYEMEGLDLLGDRTTGGGIVSIARTQALFERRLVLERSFLPELEEDASTVR